MTISGSTGACEGPIPNSGVAAVSIPTAGPRQQQQLQIRQPNFGNVALSPADPLGGAQDPATAQPAQLEQAPPPPPPQQQQQLLPVSAPQMLAVSGVSVSPQVALSQPGTQPRPALPNHPGMRSPAGYHGEALSSPLSPSVRAALPTYSPQLPPDPTVFQLTDRQVRGGMDADDVSLYAMCRRWVQNAVDVDAGPRQPVQEASAVKLPPPLVASSEAGKEPPKEVALLQDEETLFLDEDTLPAELLMEHHKEHWVMVRNWHQAHMTRDLRRWERRLDALLPALCPTQHSSATL